MKSCLFLLILLHSLKAFSQGAHCSSLFSFRNPFLSEQVVFSTGNPTKIELIKSFLSKKKLKAFFKDTDVKEIDSNPLDIAIHKASQVYRDKKLTVVEDTSLHIERANIGPLIKWHIKDLPQYIGRKARLEVIYAFLHEGKVYTFKESLEGMIKEPNRPEVHTLEPFFYPFSGPYSMKELRDMGRFHEVDPRMRALNRILDFNYDTMTDPIWNWNGAWQGPKN